MTLGAGTFAAAGKGVSPAASFIFGSNPFSSTSGSSYTFNSVPIRSAAPAGLKRLVVVFASTASFTTPTDIAITIDGVATTSVTSASPGNGDFAVLRCLEVTGSATTATIVVTPTSGALQCCIGVMVLYVASVTPIDFGTAGSVATDASAIQAADLEMAANGVWCAFARQGTTNNNGTWSFDIGTEQYDTRFSTVIFSTTYYTSYSATAALSASASTTTDINATPSVATSSGGTKLILAGSWR